MATDSTCNSSFPRKRESTARDWTPACAGVTEKTQLSATPASFPRKRESTRNSSFPRTRESSVRTSTLFLAAPVAAIALLWPIVAAGQAKSPTAKPADIPFYGSKLGQLEIWDDGLSEMCYYDAESTVYGEIRKYTRVHLTNREFFDPIAGVKTDQTDAPGVVPVFKMNIAEEIPTQNYNYRWLTTLFLNRESLQPLKAVFSSQEWCGATYKHARWTDAGATLRQFSYFEGEAESQHDWPANVWPFEASFMLAREFVAGGAIPKIDGMLPALRSNRETPAEVERDVAFIAMGRDRVTTPAGEFEVEKVQLRLGKKWRYTFSVESRAPFRVIRYDFGNESGVLRGCERRAYWDRAKPSAFYKVGQAP
ncbi:MAG: hypothetical protein KDA32_07520 [Phycisphaerales bacterium]|nr:hypothetical protein [Phycisphaerales bacterium]